MTTKEHKEIENPFFVVLSWSLVFFVDQNG